MLADQARRHLRDLGQDGEWEYENSGWQIDEELIGHLHGAAGRDRWDPLKTHRPPALTFWYRGSTDPMRPLGRTLRVQPGNPPVTDPGMAFVRLDARGRLLELSIIPPRLDTTPLPKEPDWESVFSLAGLDLTRFRPAFGRRNPPFMVDVIRSWTGTTDDEPDVRWTVVAGAYDGQVVYFDTRNRTPPSDDEQPPWFVLVQVFSVLLVVGTIWLALRNRRLDRSDAKGSFRVSLATLLITLAAVLLRNHDGAGVHALIMNEFDVLRTPIVNAFAVWITYNALEPYARRTWPRVFVGWARLVAGRFRDGRVGRELTWGLFIGSVLSLGPATLGLLPWDANTPLDTGSFAPPSLQEGPAAVLGKMLHAVNTSVYTVLSLLLGTVLLRLVVRLRFLAVSALLGVCFVIGLAGNVRLLPLESPALWMLIAYAAGGGALFVITLLRGGLLMAVVATTAHLTIRQALTIVDVHWYSDASILPISFLALLAVYGHWAATTAHRRHRRRHQLD